MTISTTSKTITTRAIELKRLAALLWNYWPLLMLGSLAAFVLLWDLGEGSLADWDEGLYAQISKQMVQSGDWITPRLGTRIFFARPPLFLWATAILYQLFWVSEFWARAASAFSGIILAMLTYRLGHMIYGKWVGFLAVMILLTNDPFLSSARVGTTDVMLTLFIYLAFYGYLRLDASQPKWWYLIWAAGALGFMVKSAGILVAPAVIVLLLWLDQRLVATIQSKHFWLGCLLACLIVIPWHGLIYLEHGQSFIDNYIGRHIIERTTSALEEHTGDASFYLDGLRFHYFPWFYLLPFALALSLRENFKGQSRSRLLLLASIVVFGVYTVVRTKLYWYIVPVYPALAILTAATVIQAFRSYKSIAFSGLMLSTLVVALTAPRNLVLIFGGIGLLIFFLFFTIKKVADGSRPAEFSLAGVKLSFSENTKEAVTRLLVHAAAGIMVLFLIGVGVKTILPLYHLQEAPVAKLAKIAGSSNVQPQEPLILFSGLWPQTALFYSNRPVKAAFTWGELAGFISTQETEIILAQEDIEPLVSEYEVEVIAEASPLAYATLKPKTPPAPLVTHEIRYRFPAAGEVFLIWGINGWATIAEAARPAGTTLTGDKVMQSPMVREGDTFIVKVQAPRDAILNYGFLITEQRNGRAIEPVWDGQETYATTITAGGLVEVEAQPGMAEQIVTASPAEAGWSSLIWRYLSGN